MNVKSGRDRVIHVVNGEHYSGAERVQDLLAGRLPEFGFDVSFACVKSGRFADSRQHKDAPVHELPMSARIDIRPSLALARIARQSQAVLLHAHTPRSLMVARLAAMVGRLPLVYHVHSPTSHDSTRTIKNWINNATERFSLRGVDRLIAVSQSLVRHMEREGISPDRIVTVPNGVPAIGPLKDRPNPKGCWTLGTVALFRPRKGLEVLLESVARLNEQGIPVRLRAVGAFETPEYEKSIRSLAQQHRIADRIDWVGFTQDVSSELARMDLFVLPSLFGEGLPMVVLESMAAGVPVVATRVEGVPEAVRDGVDGALAEPANSHDLQSVIRHVVEAPGLWQSLRLSAHQRHAQRFSDRRMAEQVADVYCGVLAQTSASCA